MHGKMSGGRTSAWALVLLILLQHLILCHGAYLSMNSNPGGFNSVGGILICAGDIFIVTQCRGDKIHGDPRIWLSGNAGTEFYNDDGCGGDDDSNDGWGVYLRYDRYTAGCETFTLKVGCNPDHNPCTGANPAYYFDRKVTRCGKGQYFSTISQACATVNQGCYQSQSNYVASDSCPETCPKGFRPSSNRDYCVACSGNTYSGDGKKCIPCSAGTQPNKDLTGCEPCPAGQYSSDGTCYTIPANCFGKISGGDVTQCPQVCAAGYYSEGGATKCTHCIYADTPKYTGSITGSWDGVGTKGAANPTAHCDCKDGFTGRLCDIPTCPAILPGFSLGGMLINADSELIKYSKSYNYLTKETKATALAYWRRLLAVEVDTSGDGTISREEMLRALKYRTVKVPSPDTQFKLWCPDANGDVNNCIYDKVSVQAMYADGEVNFKNSAGKFDGASNDIVQDINPTFPTPNMPQQQCKDGDASYDENGVAMVQLSYTRKSYKPQYPRFCGYENGLLLPDFNTNRVQTTTDSINGVQTNFKLSKGKEQVPQKSIICLLVSDNAKTPRYSCGTGLFFDGTPIDLKPELTENGIVFQFLDTSSSEIQFDIAVGDVNIDSEAKTFVVGINYASESCGRPLKPISFTDKLSMNRVGDEIEYSIRALQDIGGKIRKTPWSVAGYVVPYLVKVSGKVNTAAGTGVEGVTVTYCRIDPTTAVESTDSAMCPLISFKTNKLGEYDGEIRVSHQTWQQLSEQFIVIARYTDANKIDHKFTPDRQTISTKHLMPSLVSFVDDTVVAITGIVQFDPNNVGKNSCPFAALPVKLVDAGGGESTRETDEDGKFTLSNTLNVGFSFIIPAFKGRSWKVAQIKGGEVTWTKGTQYTEVMTDGVLTITFAAKYVITNIDIKIYDISMQTVNIGMYGGVDKAPLDIGSTTTFKLTPLDSKCKYIPTVTMVVPGKSNDYYEGQVAAMDYKVTLATSSKLPTLATINPPSGYNTLGNYKCAINPFKTPLEYFTTVEQVDQTLNIEKVDAKTTYRIEYFYFSPLCFELLALGIQNVPTVRPAVIGTEACYPANTKYLKKGDQMQVTIRLFEVYPTLSGDKTFMNKAYKILDVVVSVKDFVGGFDTAEELPYDFTMYSLTPENKASPLIPRAATYTIKAIQPYPIAPYAYDFEVRVRRNGPDADKYQKAVSEIAQTWYFPVTGVVAKEVPNFYPVATDPTLIFMVIRDPPGGNSFTTWHAGTAVEFGMSFNSMQTFEGSSTFEISGGFGMGTESDTGVAFGGLLASKTFKADVGTAGRAMDVGTVSSSRASDTHFHYSMTFSYDISTSTDPNIAGHASDVIIGGGVDIIVSDATEVYINPNKTTEVCFVQRPLPQWQPGHATTFILPVFEIEDIIRTLKMRIATVEKDATVKKQLEKQVANWKTVLSDYRSHNDDLASIFSGDDMLFQNLVKSYNSWNEDLMHTSDFLAAADAAMFPAMTLNIGNMAAGLFGIDLSDVSVDSDLSIKLPTTEKIYDPAKVFNANQVDSNMEDAASTFDDRFKQSFRSTQTSCGNVLPQYQNEIMKGVCSDFAPEKWNSLFTAINSACNMPVDPEGSKSLSQIPVLAKVCQQRNAVKTASDIPGGYTDKTVDSIFGFLNDPKKYVTFGATSPVSMSWTSTVSDSRAFTTELDTSRSMLMSEYNVFFDVTIAIVNLNFFLQNHKEQIHKIQIGKSSESSHSFERTVSITLDDSDIGDYFAVRVTEDPVYATPVFTTMGGQSKCPGESLTSRRESEVKIVRIEPRCGPLATVADCNPANLGETGVAYFAAIISSLSPTNDAADYTISLSSSYSEITAKCGEKGKMTGIQVEFDQTEIGGIPFGREIEVPFRVKRSNVRHCNKYTEIGVTITASCEQATSSSAVYQYDLKQGPNGKEVDYDVIRRESSSTKYFDVEWKTTSSRRLEEVEEEDFAIGKAELVPAAKDEVAELRNMINKLTAQIQVVS